MGEIGLTIFGERAESDGYRVNGDHQTDAGGVRLDWGGKSDFRGYLSWSLSNSAFGLPGDLNASALAVDRRQTKDSNANDRGEEKSSHGRVGLTYGSKIIGAWKIGLDTKIVIWQLICLASQDIFRMLITKHFPTARFCITMLRSWII